MNRQKADRQEAIDKLREILKPGDIVYTVLRHVSRSGMSRSIQLLIGREKDLIDISYDAARALDDRLDRERGGIKVSGCGMNMGFHLVYNLGRTLFPKGFPIHGEVYRGLCHRKTCTCHDDGAWTESRVSAPPDCVDFDSGRVVSRTYANGCFCGCRWILNGRNGDTSGWETGGGYALKHRWV